MYDQEVEVIVVGSGVAGAAAAFGAVYGGAKKVLVCEKSVNQIGGTGHVSAGGWIWCHNNKHLRELGVQQDPNEIVELLKDLVYRADPEAQIDEVDVAQMTSFANRWPKVLDILDSNDKLKVSPPETFSEEEYGVLEELYKQKMEANPERFAQNGINKENLKQLRKFFPSYCAENQLDFCPTGKVCEGFEGTIESQMRNTIEDTEGIVVGYGHRVVDLLFEDEAETVVAGVLIEDLEHDRKVKRIRASKGVIFASGGFSYNREYMNEFFDATFHGTVACQENTGDFVSICKKHEIELSGMDQAWFHHVVLPYQSSLWPGTFFLNGDAMIAVNKFGKRFTNEQNFYQERGRQMYLNQEDLSVVFLIHDDRTAKLYEGPALSFGGPFPVEDGNEDCIVKGSNFNDLTANIKALLRHCDSTIELDEHFKNTLEAQVSRFNQAAIKGKDEEFHRGENIAALCWQPSRRENDCPNKSMHPIDVNNLRCLIIGLSTLDTKGGPRINANAQIRKNDSTVMKNLYGAGNCISSFTQHSYPASGVTMASGMHFGFTAGMHCMEPGSKM